MADEQQTHHTPHHPPQPQRIRQADLTVGQPVPYSIYDTYDRLLIRRGRVLRNESQRQLLLEVGRTDPKEARSDEVGAPGDPARPASRPEAPGGEPEPPNPFDVYSHCARALGQTFRKLNRDPDEFRARLERLMARLGNIIDHDADASLGAAHLGGEFPAHIAQPIQTAILCDLVARRQGLPGPRRRELVGAALTANIGMLDIQPELVQQSAPLTPEQRAQVRGHPEVSARTLVALGIEEGIWLQAVRQHHERVDGSGYPEGLTGDAICDEAGILMVADSYLAMVGPRAHREARDQRSALLELFQTGGQLYPTQHAAALIKEMGVFPPGTPVTLSNGEVGVVTHRTDATTQPLVCVYAMRSGRRLPRPERRDLQEAELEIVAVHTVAEAAPPFSPEIAWGYGKDAKLFM